MAMAAPRLSSAHNSTADLVHRILERVARQVHVPLGRPRARMAKELPNQEKARAISYGEAGE